MDRAARHGMTPEREISMLETVVRWREPIPQEVVRLEQQRAERVRTEVEQLAAVRKRMLDVLETAVDRRLDQSLMDWDPAGGGQITTAIDTVPSKHASGSESVRRAEGSRRSDDDWVGSGTDNRSDAAGRSRGCSGRPH